MGATIRTTPGQLAGQLRRRNKATRVAVARGALRGAHRGRAIIVRETPVDQSQLKQSWKVKPGKPSLYTGERATWASFTASVLAELVNAAPHAGVVERGARPHPVSPEGIEAIKDWAMRNVEFALVSGPVPRGAGGRRGFNKANRERQAEELAQAIAWKLRHHGQEPTYFVKGNLPLLLQAVEIEVERAINAVANRGGGRDGG